MLLEPLVHPVAVGVADALVDRFRQNVTAHHEGEVLADEVGKINQRRTTAGQAGEDKNLRSIVFHVLFDVHQLLHALEGLFVRLCLCGRAPVDFRIPVNDHQVEGEEDTESDESRRPIHQEHDGNAENSSSKAQPAIVVLKSRPPADRTDKGSMKSRKVDQPIGGQEEIGNERRDGVQLGN